MYQDETKVQFLKHINNSTAQYLYNVAKLIIKLDVLKKGQIWSEYQ